jgi:hypothetical protein
MRTSPQFHCAGRHIAFGGDDFYLNVLFTGAMATAPDGIRGHAEARFKRAMGGT